MTATPGGPPNGSTVGLPNGALPLDAALADPLVRALADSLGGRPGGVATVAAGDPVPRRAAVAAVLRVEPDAGPALLLVRRAEHPGDPWSGHVALPGGRAEPGDATPWDTAARETWEETGLDLRADARLLGALDEIYPRTPLLPPIVVRPHVVVLGHPAAAPLRLSAELVDGTWVPLRALRDPAVDRASRVTVRGAPLLVPSFVHGAFTVWGMTERIVRDLLARLP